MGLKKIPGPSFFEVFKSRKKLQNPIKFIEYFEAKFPGIFRISFLRVDIVLMSDPKLIRYILQTNQKKYVKHSLYELIKIVLGNGLVTSEGTLWKRQRKMIQPSFHKEAINGFFDTMLACTNQMLDGWKDEIKTNNKIDFYQEMSGVTLQIIGKTMLSTDVKKESNLVSSSLYTVGASLQKKSKSVIKLPLWIPTKINTDLLEGRKVLDDIIYNIINERKKNGNDKGDMLDMLMLSKYEDTGESMPDKLLKDEIMTTFIAGHETTSTALMWTFHFLTQHPEVYKKIKKEIDDTIGNRELTFEDIPELKYTKCCINESMRLLPPLWIIGRKATEDNMVGDYLIKKGTGILIPSYITHRNPEYWDNPTEFIPERWETEKVNNMDKYAYFPFGAGPRMCIGNNMALLEANIILAKTIQQFTFEYAGNEPPKLIAGVTASSKDGMPMKLRSLVK